MDRCTARVVRAPIARRKSRRQVPILNNIPRKHSTIIQTGTKDSDPFGPPSPPSHQQHTSIGFEGSGYESPFTESGLPPLGTHRNISTQPQMPSSQVEQPGVIVRTQHYVRVEPHAKTVLS